MIDAVLSFTHLLLVALGLVASPDAVAVGALAVTLVLAAASIGLVAVLTSSHPTSGGASPPHPRRAIDLSSPLAQSDPDAPGHPRPRAPQSVAPAT